MKLLRGIPLVVLLSCLCTICQGNDAFVKSQKGQNASATANVFNRMCYSHPASYPSCSIGPFAPLSKRAPEPQTVGGKLIAKAAAYMYTCYQRNMADCAKDATCYWVDAESYCSVSSTYLQSIRLTTVCPQSKADISASCAALTKDAATCQTDKRCKWSACSGSTCVRVSSTTDNATDSGVAGLCLGNTASLIANDVSISAGLDDGDIDVWGCCDSQTLYVSAKKCKNIGSSTLCSGGCQWDDFRNECAPTLNAQIGVWGNKEANFSNYLSTIDSQCNQATDSKCISQPVVDIDLKKVDKYLKMSLKQVENTCPETLLSETPPSVDSLNSTTTGAPVKFSASSIVRPFAVVAGMLGMLALVLV